MVQERLWHHSQQVRLLDDYGEKVELKMQLTSLEEFSSIVLSWGSCAKVVAPAELVERVREELAAMQQMY
ncbi:WYL domain-containing protein [Rubritalea sp.]|uniref:WYL domain-containing protein n=1 Tax=Rubritalea sp. TaxID=2109375 RepID=UPI003EF1A815